MRNNFIGFYLYEMVYYWFEELGKEKLYGVVFFDLCVLNK